MLYEVITLRFLTEAKSYLHHQVRNMVGTLILVGQGNRITSYNVCYTKLLRLSEIAAIKEKVSGVEDQELEVMEALESAEGGISAFKEAFRQEEGVFKEYEAKKNAEAERVKKELEQTLV